MTRDKWNQLKPGAKIQTSKKQMEVMMIVGFSPRTGANVLALKNLTEQDVLTGPIYNTADYEKYEIKGTKRGPIEPDTRPKIVRALAAAWAAFRQEWGKQ